MTRRLWVSAYNHRFRNFDNGICWYRLNVRIAGRWCSPGGVWFRLPGKASLPGQLAPRLPGIRYLRPDKARPPLGAGFFGDRSTTGAA